MDFEVIQKISSFDLSGSYTCKLLIGRYYFIIEKKGYESCYNIQEYFENERRDQRHLAKRKLSEFVANRSLKIWKSALKIAGNPPIKKS